MTIFSDENKNQKITLPFSKCCHVSAWNRHTV